MITQGMPESPKVELDQLSQKTGLPRWLAWWVWKVISPAIEDAIEKILDEQESFDQMHEDAHRKVLI